MHKLILQHGIFKFLLASVSELYTLFNSIHRTFFTILPAAIAASVPLSAFILCSSEALIPLFHGFCPLLASRNFAFVCSDRLIPLSL